MFTPWLTAFSRSTSTSSCGTATVKLVKASVSAGCAHAFPITSCVTRSSSSKPRFPLSSTCKRKPPIVPNPITGGGGNIATKAPFIDPKFWLSWAAMAPPDRSGVVLLSKSVRVANNTPELGLLVNPLIFKPGNAIASSTPGCSIAIRDISRITSSVLSKLAALGS